MLFCIVGSGRCGSTLLMRMLNENPRLHVLNETHWLPTLHARFGQAAAPASAMLEIVDAARHVDGRQTTPIPDDARSSLRQRTVTLRQFVDAIGAAIAAEQGKLLWADKTPDYGLYMRLIQSIWPACRFIHLIRDGANVAASMAAHPGYRTLLETGELDWTALACGFNARTPAGDAPAFGPDAFLRLWRERLEGARAQAAGLRPNTYLELRYEQLCADPRPALDQVIAFTGCGPHGEKWRDRAAAMIDPRRAARRAVWSGRADARSQALMAALGYAEQHT
jgi:hypothetical protein